jgi:hypothetical protein
LRRDKREVINTRGWEFFITVIIIRIIIITITIIVKIIIRIKKEEEEERNEKVAPAPAEVDKILKTAILSLKSCGSDTVVNLLIFRSTVTKPMHPLFYHLFLIL